MLHFTCSQVHTIKNKKAYNWEQHKLLEEVLGVVSIEVSKVS